ncbi:FkbM family methyltransferase [Shimia sp.]|uniref:FkbM family methyltransferase n=1 Tax=Shimia sp. TaxID=1954381 RepID=UPI003299C212
MRPFFKKIARQFKFIEHIGLSNFIRYRLAKNGTLFTFRICDAQVTVRKGTPDLEVAITSLSGEFNSVGHLFAPTYSDTIIDAGGYIGTAAIALSRLYPAAQVIVIEPSDENIAILKTNIAAFPNIRLVQGALVPQGSDSVSLRNRGTGAWGFSVVEAPDDCPDAQVMATVPAISLSSLDIDLSKVGIMKLDIEGGEHALFLKDRECLDQIDVLIVELHERIVAGCTKAFFDFSNDRIILKDPGEKYVSVNRQMRPMSET